MVSAPTLHVVTTELAVGSFALAGVSFLLAGLGSHQLFGLKRSLTMADHVAHAALAFGLLPCPLPSSPEFNQVRETALTIPFSSTKCCLVLRRSGWRWASSSPVENTAMPFGLDRGGDAGKPSVVWPPLAWCC